jgi:hypothetical protein
VNRPLHQAPAPLDGAAQNDPDPRARAARFNARHAPAPDAPTAAKPDEGKVLAKVSRGTDGELRVSLHVYNDKPYVKVALWGADGWPVKGKAVTVRVRELGAVVQGLCTAMDEIEKT